VVVITNRLFLFGFGGTLGGTIWICFRSTFRDWAGETTAYPREVIEHAMAHQLPDKAEAAYARGTLFDKRRRLMADWADYCNKVQPTKADNIVPINSAA